MTKANEADFQGADKFHICDKLYNVKEVKVSDQILNTEFRLPKAVMLILPVLFKNLRGCENHRILHEIGKFGQDINVIPNYMEKYMAL